MLNDSVYAWPFLGRWTTGAAISPNLTEYKLRDARGQRFQQIVVKDLNLSPVPQSTMNRVVKDYIRTGRLGWILPQLAQVDND